MLTYSLLAEQVPGTSRDIDWPALLGFIPALQALGDTPQDVRHHAEGDVLTHTRMVCDTLVAMPAYQAAPVERKFVLFYAALLHDLAKPPCTVTQPDGSITSAGHSRRGAVDARLLLWRAGVPFSLREAICQIIRVHQMPFFAVFGDKSGATPEYLIRKLSWEVEMDALTTVAEADMRGRICPGGDLALLAIDAFREMAEQEHCLQGPRAFPDAATRMRYFATQGAVSADHAIYPVAGSKVIVLSGPPASGKDTWAAQHAPDLPMLSYDDAREALGVRHGSKAAGKAVHWVVDQAKALLRDQAPFVWNATHLSQQMRRKTLDLLYRYHAEVTLVYLEAPEALLLKRNALRDSTLTNKELTALLWHWGPPLQSEAHHLAQVVNLS